MTVLTDLFAQIKKRDPNQAPFHQAVEEVFQSLDPFLAKNPKYIQQGLLERIVEPELLGGRQRPSTGQPRLPCTDEFCHWPL